MTRVEAFGQRLKRLRVERRVGTTELAFRAGVTEGTIRQLEAGQTKAARLETGVLIAEALGVTPRYLAFGDAAPERK